LVLMEAFTTTSAASTLDEELDMELELVLIAERAKSVLEDDSERRRLEV